MRETGSLLTQCSKLEPDMKIPFSLYMTFLIIYFRIIYIQSIKQTESGPEKALHYLFKF